MSIITPNAAITRRTLLGSAAAGAAGLATSSIFPKPALAKQAKLKIGYVSPVTGLFAAFAEAWIAACARRARSIATQACAAAWLAFPRPEQRSYW